MAPQLRVRRERHFCPHHILLSTATTALKDAEAKHSGWFYSELTAITFSALAFEALVNAFGEQLIDRWSDYESATPIAKLRIISTYLDLSIDFSQEPWSVMLWLVKFCNKVAHAKPEKVTQDSVMTSEEYERKRKSCPPAKLESDITLANAKRSVESVAKILSLLCGKLPPEDLTGLLADGWSGQASQIHPT